MPIKDSPPAAADIESYVSDLLDVFLPAVLHLSEKQGIELSPADESEIAVLSAQLREKVSSAIKSAKSRGARAHHRPQWILDGEDYEDS